MTFSNTIPDYSVTSNCQMAVPPLLDPQIFHNTVASNCYSKYTNATSYHWQLYSHNACTIFPDDPELLSQYTINNIPVYVDPPLSCQGSNQAPEENYRKGVLNKNSISIYPTPTQNEVWLENAIQGEEIDLYNVFGCLLKRLRIDSNHQLIDLRSYSTGVYYISINNGVAIKIIKL